MAENHATDTPGGKPSLAKNFASDREFHVCLARVLGRPADSLSASDSLKADWLQTPLGAMIAVANRHALHLLEFFDRKVLPSALRRLQARKGAMGIGRFAVTDQIEAELERYFDATGNEFDTPLASSGSDFARAVWELLRDIPPGRTRSYKEVANILGRPTASRAVARVNGANQIAIAIPCHRVIGADNSLTGYGGGIWRKRWLLDHEKRLAIAI